MAEQAVQNANEIWAEALAGFHCFITRFPMLGLAHELGAAIAEEAAATATAKLRPGTWFRGVVEHDSRPRAQDFFPPDPKQIAVPEQRFNHQGQPAFYFAENARAAALECRDKGEPVIWVQRFRVGPLDGIADVRTQGLALAAATYCGDAEDGVQRPPHLKPQYMVPRFVAECLRHNGVRGILVPSVQEGTNLVLFRWRDVDIEAEGEPERVHVE